MSADAVAHTSRELAARYAAGVRAYLSPTDTRGAPPSAAGLLPTSQALKTAAEAELLGGVDGVARAAAEVRLLAGAALDLVMAGHYADSAAPLTRGGTPLPLDIAELQQLINAPEAYLAEAVRERATRSLGSARSEFSTAAYTALDSLRRDVVFTGRHIVEGMFTLEATLLVEGLAFVGGELGQRIGMDPVGLAGQVIDFVLAANEKVLALLGIDGLSRAQSYLERWLDELLHGTLIATLIEKVLQTDEVAAEISGWLTSYLDDDTILATGRVEIQALSGHYSAKVRIVEKILTVLAFLKIAPVAMNPTGRLLIAAVYLGLLAYVIGSGYDHVDSDRLKLLDWVEGVRGVSERVLMSGVG